MFHVYKIFTYIHRLEAIAKQNRSSIEAYRPEYTYNYRCMVSVEYPSNVACIVLDTGYLVEFDFTALKSDICFETELSGLLFSDIRSPSEKYSLSDIRHCYAEHLYSKFRHVYIGNRMCDDVHGFQRFDAKEKICTFYIYIRFRRNSKFDSDSISED